MRVLIATGTNTYLYLYPYISESFPSLYLTISPFLSSFMIIIIQPSIETNILTSDHSTPLHYVARISSNQISQKTKELQPSSSTENTPSNANNNNNTTRNRYDFSTVYHNVLMLLVEKGVDPNVQNSKGETCLYQAALRGSIEAVEFLLALRENKSAAGGNNRSLSSRIIQAPGKLKSLFAEPPGKEISYTYL